MFWLWPVSGSYSGTCCVNLSLKAGPSLAAVVCTKGPTRSSSLKKRIATGSTRNKMCQKINIYFEMKNKELAVASRSSLKVKFSIKQQLNTEGMVLF